MKWQAGYPLDLIGPARHAATMLEGATGGPLQLSALAGGYRHSIASDLERVKKVEKLSDWDAKCFVIQKAIEELGEGIEATPEGYRLAVPWDDLRFDGRPVYRMETEPHWVGDFDPLSTSKFVANIRDSADVREDDLEELTASMQAFGWLPQFPAIVDDRGVVIVGHRRLKVAAKLGITPVMAPPLPLGTGTQADALRWALAIASNIGAKAMTAKTRRNIAEHLYGEGWSMTAVGKALAVANQTVSKWSKEFPLEVQIRHDQKRAEIGASKAGRPRKVPEPKIAEAARRVVEGGRQLEKVVKEMGVSRTKTVQEVYHLKRLPEDSTPEPVTQPHACPTCGLVHSAAT